MAMQQLISSYNLPVVSSPDISGAAVSTPTNVSELHLQSTDKKSSVSHGVYTFGEDIKILQSCS